MSIVPASSTPAPAPRPAATTAAAAAQLSTIDPIKLLNKHKWLLVGAAIGGATFGVGVHYALASTYPMWRPIVLFNCLPPQDDISLRKITQPSEVEILRFMQTQVRIMTSDTVISRVAEDPQLISNAPIWCAQFMQTDKNTGQERFDTVAAVEELKDHVSARVIPQTNLIELAMTDRARFDATAIVGLVRQKYQSVLRESSQVLSDDRTKSIRDSLVRVENEIQTYQVRRESIIQTKGIDSIDDRMDATRMALATTNEELVGIQKDLQGYRKQLAQFKQSLEDPAGIQFPDELRAEADRDPVILDIKGDIARYETMQQGMLNRGISREHREYQTLDAQLAGAKQNLEAARTDTLTKLFEANISTLSSAIGALEAQEQDLGRTRVEMTNRLVDLNRTMEQLKDIESKIRGLMDNSADLNGELQNLLAVTQLASSNRVVLLQSERVPTEMSFPRLKMMIPAGIVVGIGLVGGIAFLRELVDQRVKGPADITIIPRTRLLGWVPDAAEDPAGQGAAETAFRDRPRGVVAESFRQIRSTVAKRIDQTDHRTFVVVAGMPGSGATSTVANLALAFAAADRKVLVIDANFRRPAMHRVFGLEEAPGLADILANGRNPADAIQATTTPNLDLLSAGSKEQRGFERLATDAMTEVLAKARSTYDMVLIDCPPAIVAGDGLALAQRCDAAILVVRAMAEKRGMVARLKNDLTDARGEFLGVIVNAVRAATGGYLKGNIRAAHEYTKA